MSELISRQWLMECVDEGWIKFDTEKDKNRYIHLVRDIAPSAQPTEASCLGCNCPKMEGLKEQKTFSEMVHLHDAETHDKRMETHSCDTISRQAAIELAMQYCPDDDGTCSKANEDIRNLLDELEDLPPAQPEIIQCKDCKYRYVDGENVRFNVCELNHNKVQSDNWYYADAERRKE